MEELFRSLDREAPDDNLVVDDDDHHQNKNIQEHQCERPAHVSPETHDLVLKTIQGGAAWKRTRELEEIRAQRLAELRREPPGVRTVGAVALLECLKHAATVVVLVTNDSPECKAVDRAMAALDDRQNNTPSDSRHVGAQKPVYLRLDATEAEGQFHEVNKSELPAILVYRAQDLVASSFRVHLDDADDLEDLLDNLGLFGS